MVKKLSKHIFEIKSSDTKWSIHHEGELWFTVYRNNNKVAFVHHDDIIDLYELVTTAAKEAVK